MAIQRLRKWGLAVGFIAALTFCGAGYAAKRHYPCMPLDALLNLLMRKGYSPAAGGEVPQINGSITFAINYRTGMWVLLGVDSDLNACVLVEGSQWSFIRIRKA